MGTSLNSNLDSLFSKMENYVSTKTVVGEPMKIDDTILLPLIDVTFGVGAGSVEQTNEKTGKDSGVGGLGARITPSAVISIHNGNVQLINIKNQDSINKIIDMVPGVVSKVDAFIKNRSANKETDQTTKGAAKVAADAFAQSVEIKTEL